MTQAIKGQAARVATGHAQVMRPGEGPQVSSPQVECAMYRGQGRAWPGVPQCISFNQEIKLLSSFELCIHGRSPLIQL